MRFIVVVSDARCAGAHHGRDRLTANFYLAAAGKFKPAAGSQLSAIPTQEHQFWASLWKLGEQCKTLWRRRAMPRRRSGQPDPRRAVFSGPAPVNRAAGAKTFA
jgi:hypothetical protein